MKFEAPKQPGFGILNACRGHFSFRAVSISGLRSLEVSGGGCLQSEEC